MFIEFIEGVTSVLEFARLPGILEFEAFIISCINGLEIPNKQAAAYIYHGLFSFIAMCAVILISKVTLF